MKGFKNISSLSAGFGLMWLTLMTVLANHEHVQSQDIHFSQFLESPLNLNPAQTGAFDGDMRFVANHRNQWKSVTTPFVTFSGSFESVLNGLSNEKTRTAFGVLFNNDRAGDSKMGMNSLGGSLSALRPIGSDSVHFISVGLMAGMTMRNIDYSALTFDEQYDGDVFNPSNSITENFDNESHLYFDLAMGIRYVFVSDNGVKFSIGSSVQHLNRPDDGFFSNKVRLFPRMQNALSAELPIGTKLTVNPSLLWSRQGGNEELLGGASVKYKLSELPGRSYALTAGSWMRFGDAIIPYVGLEYNMLRVGLSYDVNTSDLERASNGKGGYELSVAYIIKKVKPIGIKPPCPLY
jgi:type IX secretion system PorP/SprF family membrane protein